MSDRPIASFDTLADAYDRFRLGYASDVYDVLERSGVGARSRVLDIGCGTGLVTSELLARGAEVTGLDISQPMLDKAALRLPQAHFALGKAEAIPFAASSFDAVVSAQAFHWFDQTAALAECARVVRPGGAVAIWWKSLTRGDVVRRLRDEVALASGVSPIPDILATGFSAFDAAPLVGQELHVVPWNVERTAAEVLGYERSRARSLSEYGPKLETYLQILEARLGAPESRYVLSYVHYLYLGRVPAAPVDARRSVR